MRTHLRLFVANAAAVLALGMLSACDKSPTAPSNTTITIRNAETLAVMGGATIRLYNPDRIYTTDGSGEVIVTPGLAVNAPIDMAAVGFLRLETVNDRTDYQLYPIGANGISYILNIPYRGESVLARYQIAKWAGRARFVLDSTLTASPQVRANFETLANYINAKAGTAIAFVSTNTGSEPGMLDIVVRVIPGNPNPTGAVGVQVLDGVIGNVNMIFDNAGIAEDYTNVHRLGMVAYGFGESGAPSVVSGLATPSPEDDLAVKMIAMRRAGTLWLGDAERDPRR